MRMARDATIVLQNLECISQQPAPLGVGAGQAPYIWPVLVWIDDMGLGGTDLFLGESRLFLQTGMRPGDTADIPYPLGTLGHRFEDNSSFSQLLLVVMVWVGDDSPGEAVWAGCKAFSNALPAAVGANLNGLLDPATRTLAIDGIKKSVGDSVKAAISDALSWAQKLEVATGVIHLDAAIGSDFYAPADLTAADFTLSMSDTSGNSYAVHGGLRMQAPAVDVCQTQADQVTAKQKTVDGFSGQISQLQQQLSTVSPAEKPFIAAQIVQAGRGLAVAQQDLIDARAALKACRDHWAKVVGSIPALRGTPISTAS
jgi:hypothetical protein